MPTVYNERDTVYAPPGEAISDAGVSFSTIQDAIDNADKWVLVGPGTYNENITITTDDFSVIGSSGASVINGGTGHAIRVEANNVNIESLSVSTTGGGGNTAHCISMYDAEYCTIQSINILDSDSDGVRVDGSGTVAGNSIGNIKTTQNGIDGTLVSVPNGISTYVGVILGIFCDKVIDDTGSGNTFNVYQGVVGVGSSTEHVRLGGGAILLGMSVLSGIAPGDPDDVVVDGSGGDGVTIGAGQIGNLIIENGATATKVSDSTILTQGYTDNGTRTIIGGEYTSPPTIDMSGNDGSISPVDNSLNHYILDIDAGGSSVNLQGIDGIAYRGTSVTLRRAGAENVVLEHDNGTASNPLLNTSLGNETLGDTDDMVNYRYDGSAWRQTWSNTV